MTVSADLDVITSNPRTPTFQAEVTAAYAQSRNLMIVRTYSDEGLSGLGIAWRDGLKTLIANVESGRANFDCVLVYDVTRWGRRLL